MYEHNLIMPIAALCFCVNKVNSDPYFLLSMLSVLPKIIENPIKVEKTATFNAIFKI